MGYQYSGLIKHYASDNTFRSFKLLFVLYLFIKLRVLTIWHIFNVLARAIYIYKKGCWIIFYVFIC